MSKLTPCNNCSRSSSLLLRCHMSCDSSGYYSSCCWAITQKLCGVGLSESNWLSPLCACLRSPPNTKFSNHTGGLRFLNGWSPQAPMFISMVPGKGAETQALAVHTSSISAELSISEIAAPCSELLALRPSELSSVTVSNSEWVSELSSPIDDDSAIP